MPHGSPRPLRPPTRIRGPRRQRREDGRQPWELLPLPFLAVILLPILAAAAAAAAAAAVSVASCLKPPVVQAFAPSLPLSPSLVRSGSSLRPAQMLRRNLVVRRAAAEGGSSEDTNSFDGMGFGQWQPFPFDDAAASSSSSSSSSSQSQVGHRMQRRRSRVPFSQRRGASCSGQGQEGGGGPGRRKGKAGGGGGGDGEEQGSQPSRVYRGVRTSFSEVDEAGRFVRSPSVFRGWVGPDEPRFKPAAGRYHLYVSLACPWSAACLMAMYLKGLDNAVSISVAHPIWQRTKPNDEMDTHTGWVFRNSKDPPLPSPLGFGAFACDGCVQDYVNGARSVRELYEMARDTNGKFTVPVLWDKRLGTIVNNESGDILHILNTEFNEFAMNPGLDLYPTDLAAQLEETEGWLHDCVTDGVYRCGLARSQVAYEEAVDALFQGLDHAEAVLGRQRYLVGPGDRLTGADLRLFHALVRFDEVYHSLFMCNRKRVLTDYPNLLNYCRELFQLPGASLSVNMEHIRAHYYGSHPSLNHFSILPAGPRFLNELYKPHDRDRFPRRVVGLW